MKSGDFVKLRGSIEANRFVIQYNAPYITVFKLDCEEYAPNIIERWRCDRIESYYEPIDPVPIKKWQQDLIEDYILANI